ncbi:MAG TPA: DUF2267 domain-containing protein [Polyangiaceae bacterium]|jgi:uncharacterized protein (DUF2267 family)|nr:DUF2267 domain-containing protein [Polyangiaceae bacterium]
MWPAACSKRGDPSEHHLMKNSYCGVESVDRSIDRTNEWLDELTLLLGADCSANSFAALRSVLHALRDRLPLIAAARLAAQLPMLLRGVYYEGWHPDRGHVHTRSLEEFLALVERDAIHGGELGAEDKTRAVFRLLGSHIEESEVERLLKVLPAPVQELFPRAHGEIVSVAPVRSSIRHAQLPAKLA